MSNKVSRIAPAAVLIFVASLIMLPVLAHPYWGMFSDYLQIVDTSSFLMSTGFRNWWQLACADLRPGAHVTDFALWACGLEQPRDFFLFRWFLFACTAIVSYYSSVKLSSKPFAAALAVFLLFVCKPTLEVVYTLDKAELLVGLFFAITVYVTASAFHMQYKRRQIFVAISVYAASIVGAMFTKQTGQLLVVYATCLWGISFIRHSNEDGYRRISSIILTVAVVALLLYQIFYFAFGGPQFKRYNVMDYSLGSMVVRLAHYLVGMPEFTIALAVSILALVFLLDREKPFGSGLRLSLSLTVAVVVGTLGLCGWPAEICYTFYPLIVLLCPAFAMACVALEDKLKKIVLACVILTFLCAIPGRVTDGQMQLAMDSMFYKICQKLSELASADYDGAAVVLPFTDKNSFELGNTLRLAYAYHNSEKRQSAPHLHFANRLHVFEPDVPLTSDEKYIAGYAGHPGLEKCELLENSWRISPIKSGDLLLVPFGNASHSLLTIRGEPMFEKSWSDWIRWMGQLDLKPVFQFSKRIRNFQKPDYEIGWIALLVGDSPPLSIGCVDDGWVMSGCTLRSDKSLLGSTVMLTSRKSHRLRSLLLKGSRRLIEVAGSDQGGDTVFKIPLFAETESVQPSEPHDPALFLIKNVKLVKHGH
ncbi:MAG TPA: hypothetical protein V6C86_08650 [Oculatellaceae cyanobacterium]